MNNEKHGKMTLIITFATLAVAIVSTIVLVLNTPPNEWGENLTEWKKVVIGEPNVNPNDRIQDSSLSDTINQRNDTTRLTSNSISYNKDHIEKTHQMLARQQTIAKIVSVVAWAIIILFIIMYLNNSRHRRNTLAKLKNKVLERGCSDYDE